MTPHIILHVDDDGTDRLLVRRVLTKEQPKWTLQQVEDGQQAMAYLAGEGQYANRVAYPSPDLVLLDLKMPLLDGFEVLKWLRAQNEFKDLPVFVLTSSSLPQDRVRAHNLGATGYIEKSVDFWSLIAQLSSHFLHAPAFEVPVKVVN
jgi:CheY-like chemotaxis protein